jgi:hypothetical protein
LSYFNHAFEGVIEHHTVGLYVYTVIFLDPAVAANLPFKEFPKLRFEGEINEYPFAAAWQPVRGRHYAMLSKPLLKESGLTLGSRAEVRFRIADQDAVDVPDEITRALEQNDTLAAIWDQMTAGRKRGFSHYVGDAKSADIRAARTLVFVEALRDNANLTPMQLARFAKEKRK